MESQQRLTQIRETIDILLHTMRLHHRVVERRIDSFSVHHGQHRMLMNLARMGQSASQKDIADAMDVSPACVARTLKQLNALGLVEKADGADGRRNAISVSPRGRQLVQDSVEVFKQIGEQMFEGVTGEELETLNVILRRIQDNLVEMEGRESKDERPEGKV